MVSTDLKQRCKDFVARWKDAEGSEDRESQKFWFELLGNVLGHPRPTSVLDFEKPVREGRECRNADVIIKDTRVLVEMKSRGVSLDQPEKRGVNKDGSPRMVSPYEQARWYAHRIVPVDVRPKWLVTCNFDEFRIYNLEEAPGEGDYTRVMLDELPEKCSVLTFMVDTSMTRAAVEKRVSVEAAKIVGKIYCALEGRYPNLNSDDEKLADKDRHDLNALVTRLVFLLYLEDSGLIRHGMFRDYLRNRTPGEAKQALWQLFIVLDTQEEERNPNWSDDILAFPYVNGGLFADEKVVIPNFTQAIRNLLIDEASEQFDWSDISPTIFGALFESTLNKETRRSGGMHYTSIENIHKVIDPLFMDAFVEELANIERIKLDGERRFELVQFRHKLAGIKVLDPACGSGNFLTETYISLRKLENHVIELLRDAGASDDEIGDCAMVSIDQFYGIEIHKFAVAVAKTALWIAKAKMDMETSKVMGKWAHTLPLESNNNIVHDNALRVDWNEVLPASQCSYIMGNPPFYGHQWRTSEQQADMDLVFDGVHGYGKLDYVCAWYKKSADYIKGTNIQCALVSTNSICQGESVGILWRYLSSVGIDIKFAYTTFVWNNEASDQAHVHVVIVGFGNVNNKDSRKELISADGRSVTTEHINGYLSPAPDVYIENRSRSVNNDAPRLTKGSQETGGNNLILSAEERAILLRKYPQLEAVIRPYCGSREFLNGGMRYCFWFVNSDINEYRIIPEIASRLEGVVQSRLGSKTESVRRDAKSPWLFTQIRQPDTDYIFVPCVSSGRRVYVPLDFVSQKVIITSGANMIAGGGLYLFGLLSSRMHNAWLRTVGGRMKSDFRYSPAVYNSFVFPDATSEQRERIEACAQVVLDVRDNHPDDSLATLYDPDKMPADLLTAHKALDVAVEAAYGVDFGGDEEKMVAHLFELYKSMTEEE